MSNVDLGQVFTRRILADYMVSLFTLSSKSFVLDPCFGDGVFLDSIAENTDFHSTGYEIDTSLFCSYKSKASNVSLYNADFLLGNINMKFDGIIMNPPYVRHEKIDDMESFGITKCKLNKEPIFSKLPRSANLYMYFVVKALNVLKANGELIVIFPESWLNSKGGSIFRNHLDTHCSVEKRIHVSGKAFERDALVDVVILKLKKNINVFDCEPVYVCIDGNDIKNRVHEQFQMQANNRVPFSDYATIRRGLTTGCNEIFINPNLRVESHNLVELISSPKSVKGFCTKDAATDNLLVIRDITSINSELTSYLATWEKRILESNKPKTLAMKIRNGEKWYLTNTFDCRGIIFGYMVRKDMRFIINNAGLFARDNFYVIYPTIDCFVMLALLNNYYVYTQLELNGRKYGGGMLKLQKYDVELLTLANLSIMSNSDTSKLADFGRRLSESGEKNIVDDITILLSAYEPHGLDDIKFQCNYLRNKRLENAK